MLVALLVWEWHAHAVFYLQPCFHPGCVVTMTACNESVLLPALSGSNPHLTHVVKGHRMTVACNNVRWLLMAYGGLRGEVLRGRFLAHLSVHTCCLLPLPMGYLVCWCMLLCTTRLSSSSFRMLEWLTSARLC